MSIAAFEIRPGMAVGLDQPLLLIAGPCVIESEDICLRVAAHMQKVCADLGVNYVFKSSFDKANRTSLTSYRGPGLEEGLRILAAVREQANVPVLTDIHEASQVDATAAVVDILQIPAFLCRQTDLLVRAGRTGRTINIKKGQFMAPEDMRAATEKILSTGNRRVMLTERGTTFGYHNLVVDMRALTKLATLAAAVVFDATHAVQLPGGQGNASGGERQFVAPLARAAAAVGINGLFLEVHPEPDRARSDGPNSLPLEDVEPILKKVVAIHELVR